MLKFVMKIVFALYYRYTSFLNALFPIYKTGGMEFEVPRDVCHPMGSEQKFAELLPENCNVLEIGCGSGAVTSFLAKKKAFM